MQKPKNEVVEPKTSAEVEIPERLVGKRVRRWQNLWFLRYEVEDEDVGVVYLTPAEFEEAKEARLIEREKAIELRQKLLLSEQAQSMMAQFELARVEATAAGKLAGHAAERSANQTTVQRLLTMLRKKPDQLYGLIQTETTNAERYHASERSHISLADEKLLEALRAAFEAYLTELVAADADRVSGEKAEEKIRWANEVLGLLKGSTSASSQVIAKTEPELISTVLAAMEEALGRITLEKS